MFFAYLRYNYYMASNLIYMDDLDFPDLAAMEEWLQRNRDRAEERPYVILEPPPLLEEKPKEDKPKETSRVIILDF